MSYSGIGGQAVMEGIMMRNRDQYAVAVRLPDGSINIDKKSIKDPGLILKIPLIRGVYSLVMSLKLGIGTLMHSASFFEDEEPATKKTNENKDLFLAIVPAIILAIGVFVALPYVLSRLTSSVISESWLLNLIEGVIKFILFLAYMIVISYLEDIKRVYMYHGAEHKCINCVENGLELNIENVRNSTRFHKRCGTSFLFIIILISIIVHVFITIDSHLWQVVIRIAIIPLIAGVGYEFIRLAGRSNNPIIGLFSKPGLLIQRITTREPTDDMIEVGIASVNAVFDWREFQGRPPLKTISQTFVDGMKRLEEAGIEDAKIDAGIIMEHTLGIDTPSRHVRATERLSEEDVNKFMAMIDERSKRIPLQHLTGHQEFYGLDFVVSKDVLCPRQDTEVLVERVLKDYESEMAPKILDLCTGSGCVLITLLKSLSFANGTGVDISAPAIEIAKENTKLNGVNARFLEGDLYSPIPEGEKFDIITANPPYIPSDIIEKLMPEVRDHEPRQALDGGKDGLDYYRRLAKESQKYLSSGGKLYMEIGYDQGPSVTQIFTDAGYEDVRLYKDLAGDDRVVVAKTAQ